MIKFALGLGVLVLGIVIFIGTIYGSGYLLEKLCDKYPNLYSGSMFDNVTKFDIRAGRIFAGFFFMWTLALLICIIGLCYALGDSILN